MTVTAPAGVSVTALETATIRANDLSSVVVQATGSSIEEKFEALNKLLKDKLKDKAPEIKFAGEVPSLNALVVTNAMVSSATATVVDSEITATAGAVVVAAKNTSPLSAEITAKTQAPGVGVGVTLAFNTVGWNAQNVLFNFIDALLGIVGEQHPAAATASVTGTPITAGGGISVTAQTAAAITSHVKAALPPLAVSAPPEPPTPGSPRSRPPPPPRTGSRPCPPPRPRRCRSRRRRHRRRATRSRPKSPRMSPRRRKSRSL